MQTFCSDVPCTEHDAIGEILLEPGSDLGTTVSHKTHLPQTHGHCLVAYTIRAISSPHVLRASCGQGCCFKIPLPGFLVTTVRKEGNRLQSGYDFGSDETRGLSPSVAPRKLMDFGLRANQGKLSALLAADFTTHPLLHPRLYMFVFISKTLVSSTLVRERGSNGSIHGFPTSFRGVRTRPDPQRNTL